MRFSHILIAATVGAGVIWYAGRAGNATSDGGAAPASRPPASSAPSMPAMPPMHQTVPSQPAAVPSGSNTGRLEDHVAIFNRSDDPAMALTAFHLIENCVAFQRNEARHYDEKTGEARPLPEAERRRLTAYCGGMTEAIKRDRLAYLEKAVKGGAAGAAMAFASAGPFGDPTALETRPGDPLVKEWQKQAGAYLVQGAHSGDITALMYLHARDGVHAMPGTSPVLRHAAGIAVMRIMTAARNGKPGVNPFDEEQLQAPATLDKEQLALARTMADELVAAHLERKKQDGSRTFAREHRAAAVPAKGP